uniref:Uncharacterized protein n=1 Tax=Arundo donax TaxID=35708 RepID=A0A0A9CS61_ARUDO
MMPAWSPREWSGAAASHVPGHCEPSDIHVAFTAADAGTASGANAPAMASSCFRLLARSSSPALYASERRRMASGSEFTRTLNSSYSRFTFRRSRTKSTLTLFLGKSLFWPKYASGQRGSTACFRQKGTHVRAKLAVSASASKVRSAPPSSER